MLLVWDGRPTRSVGSLIAAIEGDISGDTLQELSEAASEQEFWEIAARIQHAPRQVANIDAAAASPSTFHIGFFRGSVQASYGERGFVPLSNFLTYSQGELMTYMAERQRIQLPGRELADLSPDPTVH